MKIKFASVVIVIVLGSCGLAHAQEDYVVLKTFTNTGTLRANPSPLERGRDGKFYAFSGNEAFTIALDGTYVPLPHPLVSAISVDGGDGYFYRTTRLLGIPSIVKFAEGQEDAPIVLYAFADTSQGFLLGASLVLGTDGQLYGIVKGFGAQGGTFFRLSTDGIFTPLYTFSGVGLDGDPMASLIRSSDGYFYGTTFNGGSGHGLIFRIDQFGTLTPIHAFTGSPQGSSPHGALVEASDGWLYGTTALGGTGAGTIFKVRPDGTFAMLAALPETVATSAGVGTYTLSALIEASDGNFYGTSESSIFRVNPAGSVRLLHSTRAAYPGWAGADRYGRNLSGVLEGADGNFYGTAATSGPGPGGDGLFYRLNRDRSACTNVVTPIWQDYNGGTLYLLGAVKSETPAIYGTWLVSLYGVTPLWLSVTQAITPTFSYELAFAVPDIGTVGVYTVIVTSNRDVCTDWKTVPTRAAVNDGSR